VALNENTPTPPTTPQPAAQLRYALLLDWGARIGFVLLVAGFTAYLFGWWPPHVPVEQLPALWNQPLAVYLERTGTPTGWHWLALAHKTDLGNLVGIVVLAGCSLPPLLAVIALSVKQRERAFATICALEVGIIVLAASGVLTSGR